MLLEQGEDFPLQTIHDVLLKIGQINSILGLNYLVIVAVTVVGEKLRNVVLNIAVDEQLIAVVLVQEQRLFRLSHQRAGLRGHLFRGDIECLRNEE